MLDPKLTKIQTLKYIVFSRWFMHLGILLLGLIQKMVGVAQFDPHIFALLALTYSYNLAYLLFLRRDPKKISNHGLYIISILQVVVDQLIYTIIIYSTGGIESLSFLFYFITIFMAILLFNEIEIIILTLLSGVLYLMVIIFEYIEIIPHHFRYALNPGFYQNMAITVHNSATVVLIIIFTAFFAAFIGRIINSREEALKAETNKVNTTLNNLIDGVIVFDTQGRISLINPTVIDLFNVAACNLLGKKLEIGLVDSSLIEIVEHILKCFEKESNQIQEFTFQNQGETKSFKITCLTLYNKQIVNKGFLIILRNITREKELDQLKSDFISIAAHQLRTPLSTIKWLFKMLLEGDAGKLTDKQQNLIGKGFQRNNEVIEIVNNFLDISEIEEGKTAYKMQFNSIEKIMQQIYQGSIDNAKHKKLKFIYQKNNKPLPLVWIDLQKIRLAIQNLVDNAIKYTHEPGTVTMAAEVQNHQLIIKISDTGIGIPKVDQKQIFSKFFRSNKAVSTEPTGSGLGLYIVKNIIEKHGGHICFESFDDKGTIFLISLPITE
ncbi:MAG: ATP-binding protein [Patescibacteria group bacterium]